MFIFIVLLNRIGTPISSCAFQIKNVFIRDVQFRAVNRPWMSYIVFTIDWNLGYGDFRDKEIFFFFLERLGAVADDRHCRVAATIWRLN